MAEECTDIATVEELSLFCRLVENGSPVEYFIGTLSLKKGNESIYSTLIDWLKKTSEQCHKLAGLGFDDAEIFAGKKSEVQPRLKKNAPQGIFTTAIVLASAEIVQAANST